MKWSVAGALALVGVCAAAQEPSPTPSPAPDAEKPFRFGGEIKTELRHSKAFQSPIFFPFAPGTLPPGQTQVFMKTPDPGTALELQYLSLTGQGEITSGVFAKFEVRLSDLYNRNPTSSDDRVFIRQAYVRFGDKPDPLDTARGSNFYALAGMAPRFTKLVSRRLESYGLWGTAIGRFEEPQLEIGAPLGTHAYARAMIGDGNPLFMRDTNALAGDNGTPERQPGHVDPIYESGFPILYDAKRSDLRFHRLEWGAGLGTRFGKDDKAIDGLAWYFTRHLADEVALRGTSYSGDLELLRGDGYPLPFSGDKKREWGLNIQARFKGLRLFGQYVDQDIAKLPRHGVEIETAWLFQLPGLFLVKESPFGNWIQPAFRFSWIDNQFTAPFQYPALSIPWDWKKYDFGVRFGLVRGVDLTAEYTLHWVFRFTGLPNLPMDEFLLTLRAGF